MRLSEDARIHIHNCIMILTHGQREVLLLFSECGEVIGVDNWCQKLWLQLIYSGYGEVSTAEGFAIMKNHFQYLHQIVLQ